MVWELDICNLKTTTHLLVSYSLLASMSISRRRTEQISARSWTTSRTHHGYGVGGGEEVLTSSSPVKRRMDSEGSELPKSFSLDTYTISDWELLRKSADWHITWPQLCSSGNPKTIDISLQFFYVTEGWKGYLLVQIKTIAPTVMFICRLVGLKVVTKN